MKKVNKYLNIEIIITPFLEPRIEGRIKFVASFFLNLQKVNIIMQLVKAPEIFKREGC